MLIRCEMLKKLANAFIEVAKEENLPVNITMAGLIQTPAVPDKLVLFLNLTVGTRKSSMIN